MASAVGVANASAAGAAGGNVAARAAGERSGAAVAAGAKCVCLSTCVIGPRRSGDDACPGCRVFEEQPQGLLRGSSWSSPAGAPRRRASDGGGRHACGDDRRRARSACVARGGPRLRAGAMADIVCITGSRPLGVGHTRCCSLGVSPYVDAAHPTGTSWPLRPEHAKRGEGAARAVLLGDESETPPYFAGP